MQFVGEFLLKENAFSYFFEPVREVDAPGYYAVIRQPMDFGTIKGGLVGGLVGGVGGGGGGGGYPS